MSHANCQDCTYWRFFGDEDTETLIGTCHRYPPAQTPKSTMTDDPDAIRTYGSGHWSQPTTTHTTWCGEFKPDQR